MTTQTPTITETYNALLAEKRELREAIKATQVDERTGTPQAIAMADAKRYELGNKMAAVDGALFQLGPQARHEQTERVRIESADMLADVGYRDATQSAALALAVQLEAIALTAAMNKSARDQGLLMPALPRMQRMALDDLLTWCHDLSQRGLLDLEALPPAYAILLEGGM